MQQQMDMDDNDDTAMAAVGETSRNNHSIQRQLTNFHRYFTWKQIRTTTRQNIPPAPRSGAASVVVRNQLFIFGGYGGGTGRLNDFWSFDFETGLWDAVPVASAERPGCRENNGVVISDSDHMIYLFGGYNGVTWLNDLWQYDINTHHWTCIQGSSGTTRGNAADSTNAAGAAAASNNVNNTLIGPSRRFGYVAVALEVDNSNHSSRKLVLFGGFDGNRWLNDLHVFDFSTSTWTEIPAKGPIPSARSCPAWVKDGNCVYVQGGYDGIERKSDFFCLDLGTYTWTELPCLGTPPSPRYFHSCCLYGNRLYCYGGYSGSERLSDMFAYDFQTNHWSVVDCRSGDVPSGRSSLVAQVYKNSLYVFGGYNGANVLNDFFRFKLQPIGVPPTGLVGDMYKLLDNPETADVCFAVEGRHVHAHKAILVVRSEFFRAMLLRSGMKETGTEPIAISHISYPVFVKVMEYIYTDCIQETSSLEIGIHLMIASEQFMLDRLKALCEDLIQSEITVETVISILIASHRHNALALKELALEFIQNHLDDPVVMRGLSDLKTEPDLLLELVRRKQTSPPFEARPDRHDPFGMNARDASNVVFPSYE